MFIYIYTVYMCTYLYVEIRRLSIKVTLIYLYIYIFIHIWVHLAGPHPTPPKKVYQHLQRGTKWFRYRLVSSPSLRVYGFSNPSKRYLYTLLGTITYPPKNGTFESMIFLFPRWDMLIPWRVYHQLIPVCYIHHPPRWWVCWGTSRACCLLSGPGWHLVTYPRAECLAVEATPTDHRTLGTSGALELWGELGHMGSLWKKTKRPDTFNEIL